MSDELKNALREILREELMPIQKQLDRIESRLEATFEQVVRNSEDISDVKNRITVVNRRIADFELDFKASKH